MPEVSGEIRLDGQDLGTFSPDEIARHIAYLPQSRSVPDITVSGLALHGRFPSLRSPRRYRREDYDKAAEALERVGLTALAHRNMTTLSGGHRQMAYLAMALAQDTDVILMDEPTTFLDIRNQLELLDRARALAAEGKTVVVILHDFEAALHYADHVVLLSEGRILKAGAAEEVLRSRELAEAFGITPGFYKGEDGLHVYVKGQRLDNPSDKR